MAQHFGADGPVVSRNGDPEYVGSFCPLLRRFGRGFFLTPPECALDGEGEDPERRLTESGAAACVPPGGRRTRPARSLASQARTAAGVPANEKGHAIAKAGPDVRGKKQRRSRSPTDTDKEPSPSQVPLRIGDLEAVTELYRSRLLRVLQLGCRSVAKAWVKALQPRKQTNYPYRGRGATRPPWWPADVPHVEPDHLSKVGKSRPHLGSC